MLNIRNVDARVKINLNFQKIKIFKLDKSMDFKVGMVAILNTCKARRKDAYFKYYFT